MTYPIEGADYFVYLVQLPPKIFACVVLNPDGTFSMYLDPRRDYWQRIDDWEHEIWHILRNDFYNGLPIQIIEAA